MDVLTKIASKLAQVIRRWDDVVVVGHHDADGITSTAILVKSLERLGKEVRFTNLKQLYSDDVERIQNLGEHFIFADLGVGQLPFLLERMEKPFVVLDHHRIPPGVDYPYLLHPFLAGLDGSREISGAGVSYVLSRVLGDNTDLAAIAVVGAAGDMQLGPSGLLGYNRNILRDAISSGNLFAYRDLALYGRASRPLPYMFVFSTEPILPGLTANEEAVFEILSRAGISLKDDSGSWRAYVDLSMDEKRALFTELALHLSRAGWSEKRILGLISEVYDLTNEEIHSPLREVREFSTLLNACGRHGHPDVGVYVAMGDRENYYQEALRLLSEHRRVLREGIEWVLERGISEGENIVYFHAYDVIPSTVVGIVAGMLYGSGMVGQGRPILAFAYEGDYVKVSARATSLLVSKGLDLSKVLRKAAERVGGEAGGHRPAAGARIPKGTEEDFIKIVDREVGKAI